MKKTAIAVMLFLASCGTPTDHKTEKKKVYDFGNGKVGYQDDGVWYYIWLTQQQQQMYNYRAATSSSGTSYSSTPFRIPASSGGGWTVGRPPTEQEKAQAQEEEAEQEISTEAETEASESVDQEATEATSESAETSSDVGSDSGYSDSGSSDSGGGGGE